MDKFVNFGENSGKKVVFFALKIVVSVEMVYDFIQVTIFFLLFIVSIWLTILATVTALVNSVK